MGRYISTGIIFQYQFEKSGITGVETPEIKQQIIDQFPPEIYEFEEDEKNLFFSLSGKVQASDVISAMNLYYSLVGRQKYYEEEMKKVTKILDGKTVEEAYYAAQNSPSYIYQTFELGFRYGYYGYPLTLNGKRKFYEVHIDGVKIESSPAKTSTEDDLLSYDFFTDLLRYRMKPERMADAMLVYLSP